MTANRDSVELRALRQRRDAALAAWLQAAADMVDGPEKDRLEQIYRDLHFECLVAEVNALRKQRRRAQQHRSAGSTDRFA